MWLFAMFDLPVDKPELRREYTQFRAALLKQGFTMLQYSVYVHYVASEDSDETLRRKVHARPAQPRPGEDHLNNRPAVRKNGDLCREKTQARGRPAYATRPFLKFWRGLSPRITAGSGGM